jgi:hypothetical protein
MDKVKNIICKNNFDFNYKKPKNSIQIYFLKMEEGNGYYEISNKGHIRSNYGTKKILKYQYYSVNEPRVNLRNKDKKQEQYSISVLMKKYHPDEYDEWRLNHTKKN